LYLKSVDHFETLTEKAKVDAELSTHPFINNYIKKMDILRNRKSGEPNPFILGHEEYNEYVNAKTRKPVVDRIAALKKRR
jgi:metallo-beta-lactamase class B